VRHTSEQAEACLWQARTTELITFLVALPPYLLALDSYLICFAPWGLQIVRPRKRDASSITITGSSFFGRWLLTETLISIFHQDNSLVLVLFLSLNFTIDRFAVNRRPILVEVRIGGSFVNVRMPVHSVEDLCQVRIKVSLLNFYRCQCLLCWGRNFSFYYFLAHWSLLFYDSR